MIGKKKGLILVPILLALALLLVILVVAQPWFDTYGIIKAARLAVLPFINTVENTVYIFVRYIWLYIPLAAVGIWRWGVWLFKRICAQYYRPIYAGLPAYYSTLSIITPVYDEDPKIFATIFGRTCLELNFFLRVRKMSQIYKQPMLRRLKYNAQLG